MDAHTDIQIYIHILHYAINSHEQIFTFMMFNCCAKQINHNMHYQWLRKMIFFYIPSKVVSAVVMMALSPFWRGELASINAYIPPPAAEEGPVLLLGVLP